VNIEIGSYEAKTKLPELLRGIQAGNRYTITLRGKPVADLVPTESGKGAQAAMAADQMRALMLSGKPVKDVDVKALINEGRA
jgi:prevent-host-death family protein